MLSPFDDYPIHPSADPIAHPVSADPNHYDRYFFNGQDREGTLFFAAAMGHYPVRGVIDAAFSLVADGVEHSVFASGRMPLDRKTAVGPIDVTVVEPLRTINLSVDPGATGISANLTFRARTAAIEEPRQKVVTDDGIVVMDSTRLTQWGTWQGSIGLDGMQFELDRASTLGTRDRSWGTRPVGPQVATNRLPGVPQLFWLWAPLHFDGFCSHLALHERTDGSRWLETAMLIPLLNSDSDPTYGVQSGTVMHQLAYELDFEPGRREVRTARFSMVDPSGARHLLELKKLYTFRMRGIGYGHPTWSHGTNHGALEVSRESIPLPEFDPADLASAHIQNVVEASMDGHHGVGVLEQYHLGPHQPTGLAGFLDGYEPRRDR